MEKPDLKKLGLGIGEDVLVRVVKEVVRPYAEWYVVQSENKIDDVVLPFMGMLEDALVDAIDKIDGEENK